MSAPEPVVRAAGLTKSYGRQRGIRDVSFDVAGGEIFGFLGPNGAGKTTTIRLLIGLIRPQRGDAWVLGRDARRIDRGRLGVVPGELSLYEKMTGAQLLEYLAALSRRTPVRRRALLDRFELSAHDLARPIRHYSRGMKQKLGIVQALQHDPDLVIMDEPSEGLDPLMQIAFYELLRELQAAGRTVFISSHLLWEVERVCDRVAIIREGVLVAVERIEVLRQRSLRRVEVEFARTEDARAFRPPSGTVDRLDGARLTLLVPKDGVESTLQAIARYPVADLVWERPNLEDIFLAYYREAPDGR